MRMLYAHDHDGNKIEAVPDSLGFCPGCRDRLVPRCGPLKVWHWSHKGRRDCDDWYEPETEWHLGWKKLFGKENCEVVMPPHRADVLGNSGVVIELQHSNISPTEIRKREEFYKKMIWVVDAHPFIGNLKFFRNVGGRWIEPDGKVYWPGGGGTWWGDEFLLLWKRPQERWLVKRGALMPVILDISNAAVKVIHGSVHSKSETLSKEPYEIVNDSLFLIKSLYESAIGGKFVSKRKFLERYKPAASGLG